MRGNWYQRVQRTDHRTLYKRRSSWKTNYRSCEFSSETNWQFLFRVSPYRIRRSRLLSCTRNSRQTSEKRSQTYLIHPCIILPLHQAYDLHSLSLELLLRSSSQLESFHEVLHSWDLHSIHSWICLYQESIMQQSRFLRSHATSDTHTALEKHNDLPPYLSELLYYHLGYFFS